MIKRKLIPFTLMIILFFSCEKILFEEEMASTSPQKNFEYL
jgi:hypothetical protein